MIKPLRDDILVKFRTSNDQNLTSGGIWMKENTTQTEYEYYDVVSVGPDVKDVEPGDVVMLSWARLTPPFRHDNEKYAVTSYKEVWAVVDLEG